MKNFSAPLLAFLAANPAYNRADLFAITIGQPQNLLEWSQQLQNSPWTVFGTVTNPTVTGNATAAPDGTTTAAEVLFPTTGVGQEAFVNQTSAIVPIVGMSYTFSIWIKGVAPCTTHLRMVQTTGQNDTIVAISATTSWQRFSMTITPVSVGTGALDVRLEQPGSSSTESIFAWGAQLEIAATPGVYTPTQASTSGPIAPRSAIYATSGQVDITYNLTTFYSSKYGAWQRGKVTSEASFGLHSNSMSLTVLSPATLLFLSSSVSYMAAALAGLFDAALVQVFTAYWPLNAQPNPYLASLGVENKFVGYILPDGQIGRSKIEFSVADPLLILNQKTPPNIIQASCRHTLYNPNCTLSASSFASSNTVGAGSTTQSITTGTVLGNSPPYYSQGFITFTSGQNSGLTYSIKSQGSTSNILLASKTLLPVTIGDSFTIYAGCDKTTATCNSRFNNLIHFGGQPFVPNPEVAI
jgi:uncharacterized phage protein (TIGR02218 family)